MAVTQQHISIFRGEDVDLNFTMVPVVDITGWTIEFTVATRLGTPTKYITGAVGIVTNGTDGLFTVSLTNAQTQTPGLYFYDVWRMDDGFHRLLATGRFYIQDEVRIPLV